MNTDLFLSALPLISLWGWIGLGIAGLLALGGCLLFRVKTSVLRWAGMCLILIALLNLVLNSQERSFLPDTVTIIVDESASQRIGGRLERTEQALDALTQALDEFDQIDVSVIRSSGERETRLFDSFPLPPENHGATILITDGQVHDRPDPNLTQAPIHLFLSGRRDEVDRRLIIQKVPRFGLLNHEVQALILIEQDVATDGETATLSLKTTESDPTFLEVPIGTVFEVTLPIQTPGDNVFELSIDPLDNELTTLNNRATIAVNGIRDRLQVLMVSGLPYSGQRVWRNILKSDPSIDLIHFTILRTIESDISIPQRELSLISFPTRELFEERLSTFDLVIFDRYQKRGYLSDHHFEFLMEYVKGGGALLILNGPESLLPLTIFTTPLKEILPVEVSTELIEKPFYPRVTEAGSYHPVTQDLVEGSWGQWFRQVSSRAIRGHTLLSGADGHPLLILSRVEEGRVAQLTSDQIWLWVRGQGGPYAPLLRRLVHWLMQEPELEENRLRASISDGLLTVERHSMEQEAPDVTITMPDQTTTAIPLTAVSHNRYQAQVPVSQIGIYRIEDGVRSAIAGMGDFNTPEHSDLKTTDSLLRESVERSGGGIYWLSDDTFPRVIHRSHGALAGGDWLGVKNNRAYLVSGLESTPLLSHFLLLAAILFFLIGGWYREGR